VRSRIFRLIGLSSTISVRKPPDKDEEKESRCLWRGKYFRGEAAAHPPSVVDVVLVVHFDIGGLQGGVIGAAEEADMKNDEVEESSGDLSAA
jgi:hypothetical protein